MESRFAWKVYCSIGEYNMFLKQLHGILKKYLEPEEDDVDVWYAEKMHKNMLT